MPQRNKLNGGVEQLALIATIQRPLYLLTSHALPISPRFENEKFWDPSVQHKLSVTIRNEIG